jgi:hypothetical protein
LKSDNRYRPIRLDSAAGLKFPRQLSRAFIGNAAGKVGIKRGDVVKRPKGAGMHSVSRKAGAGFAFIGPSVEGIDKEYVKVLTGDVDWGKPSFV